MVYGTIDFNGRINGKHQIPIKFITVSEASFLI